MATSLLQGEPRRAYIPQKFHLMIIKKAIPGLLEIIYYKFGSCYAGEEIVLLLMSVRIKERKE
jgi:hypothetical protein